MTVISFIKSTKLGAIMRHHGIAIGAALVVAIVAGLPQLIVRDRAGELDKGVPYLVNDSEGEYLSRVREVLDGHHRVASPTMYEYKDARVLMPPYAETLFYALPTIITGASLESVIFYSKWILPALLFLVIYLFVRELLLHKDASAQVAAVSAGLLVVLGYDAYDYRHFFQVLVHGASDPAGLLWNRLVHPITGGILLFAFLWQLSKIVLRKESWSHVVAASLILACTPGYFFAFGLSLGVLVCSALYASAWRWWRLVARLAICGVIGVGLNLPYLAGALMATNGDASGDAFRSGMFATHASLINYISFATLSGALLVFLFSVLKGWDWRGRWWLIVLSVGGTMVLVYNQQIITGRAIWPQHFVQYTTPLSMALLVTLIHNILRERSLILWRLFISCIIIIALFFGWRGFQSATYATVPKYMELQSFSGVISYLQQYAKLDCVVYAFPAYPNELSRFIPALTGCNNYHSFYIYSGIPRERILHNYLVNLRFRNLLPKDVRRHFYSEPFFSTSYFFRDWNDMLCNNLSGCGDRWQEKFADTAGIDRWFDATEREIEEAYSRFLEADLYVELMKFKLDYVVVDRRYDALVNDQIYSFLRKVHVDDQFILYSVRQIKSR